PNHSRAQATRLTHRAELIEDFLPLDAHSLVLGNELGVSLIRCVNVHTESALKSESLTTVEHCKHGLLATGVSVVCCALRGFDLFVRHVGKDVDAEQSMDCLSFDLDDSRITALLAALAIAFAAWGLGL